METIYLSITAGNGPEECAHAVALTLQIIKKETEEQKEISMRILETEGSRIKGNCRSALIAIEGKNVRDFSESWTGIIQWIWQSEYRPHHKRKNWFISVKPFVEPKPGEVFSPENVHFETSKAGGPGGQHVNKTETAVRAMHIPTGKSVVARGERSQLLNKKIALIRLSALVEKERADKELQVKAGLRHSHWELERGNPVRVYDGKTLKLIRSR